ncbi:MAG: PASTA domain-containing protein, partial [Oscillospiraceae bacterium]|nr:PASTA domain-containing protein [Oscillospiraceae bacterium]
ATIVHRGLSTDSIYIDERGKLKLTAFGISASRTVDQSLNCELLHGYAAPEQYAVSERQGPWTDIYGVCALLYHVLTGVKPQAADERLRDDALAEPFLVNHSVPHNVSRAVMAGLILDSGARIHNMNLLVSKLFEQPRENDASDGPVRPAVAIENIPSPARQEKKAPARKPQQKSKKKSKKNKEKSSNIGTIIGFSVFLAIVVGFIIAIIYFSDQTNQLNNPAVTTTTTAVVTTTPPVTTLPPRTTTAEPQVENVEKIILPDFVDRFYNTLESRYPQLTFEAVFEYNDSYSKGIVFEQDIPEGTEVTGGTVITLKVSEGPESVELPDYVGKKLKDYTAELDELGIKYETEPEETTEVKKNYVVRCDKEIGDRIMVSEDETVIVYYAVKPETTEASGTENGDAPAENTENAE